MTMGESGTYLRYAVRRVALAVLSVYVVVTAVLVATYPVMQGLVEAAIRAIRFRKITEYEKERLIASLRTTYDVDASLPERLVDWWVNVPTFDWGTSVVFGEPVVAVLDGRVVRTLAYVLPGFVLAVLGGVLAGVGVALARNATVEWSPRLVAYSLMGVPVFMLLYYMGALAGAEVAVLGTTITLPRPGQTTLAALAVAATLLASQVRFARAAALERSGRPFVKMLRAKGVGRIGLARHLLRNVAVPLVSLSIGELLGTLAITVYVAEAVLGIDGLGAVSLTAVQEADLPLLVGSILVIVYLGIAASLCRDLLAGYLDPRLRTP